MINGSKACNRRTLIGGTVAAAVVATRAGSAGASPPPAMGPILAVPDRAAMLALTIEPGQLVFLLEPGREGHFQFIEGDASDDPLQGLSIPVARRGFRFARVWDGTHGRPEWFGARTGDGTFDCSDAIETCYALCPVTELAQADYFIHRTLRFAHGWRTLRGVGNYANDTGHGTRIILHRSAPGLHTDDIILVGAAELPGPGGDRGLSENHFSGLTLIRDGAAAPDASGDLTRYPTGLRASHLFHCTFRQITSLESSVGFYIGGVVYTKFDDCFAIRVRPGTSADQDFAVGFYLNGHVSFGYAGGNASLYMSRCAVADQHPQHVTPTALLARGAFVDTFLDAFESARVETGIVFDADSARGEGQTIDLHIRNAIIDGCTRRGIDIALDATASASVEIIDPYVAASSGNEYGIAIRDGAGLVTVTGGQVHGEFGGGSLHLSRTRGIRIQGTKIHQANRPVVIDQADGVVIEAQINNWQKQSRYAAVEARRVSRSIIRPIIIGAAGAAFGGGVDLDTHCHHNSIDGTAINPDCLADGSAAKVRFDMADARSNVAFAAAGNILVGVLD